MAQVHQQAFINQRGQDVPDLNRSEGGVQRRRVFGQNRFRRLQCKAPGKDGQPSENRLFVAGQEVVTPGDGIRQGLLVRRSPVAAFGHHADVEATRCFGQASQQHRR